MAADPAARGGVITRFRAMPPTRQAGVLIAAIVVLGTIVRIPQLSHALAEAYSFRQSQTAFTAREFAEHGINLFSSPLPVFGPHATVPMEFPLFQALAALPTMAGMPADAASRLVGLLFFQLSAVLLGLLLIRWHGRVVAVVGVLLFEFLPFGLQWGAASLIEFMAVAMALLMVLGLDHWFDRGSVRWLVLGSVAAVIGFLVKVTTVPPWGVLVLISVILVLRRDGWRARWKRVVGGVLVGPGVGFAAAIAWTAYADSIKRAAVLTEPLTSGNLREWNFGTLLQRLDTGTAATIVGRIGETIVGFGMITLLIAIAAAIFHPSFDTRVRIVGWFGVAVSGPLVFTNLYVVHSYYLIAIYPAFVALIAIGLVWAVRLIPSRPWQRMAVGAVAVLAVLASTALSPLGRNDLTGFAYDAGVPGLSTLMKEQTKPEDLIILTGCDWDPTWLFYAERSGVMLWRGDPQAFWATNDIADYEWLLTCDQVDPQSYLPEGWVVTPTENSHLMHVGRQ